MKHLYFDKSLRKCCNFVLIPIKNVESIEAPEEGELETARLHLKTIDGLMVLNSKEFFVNGKPLDDAIIEAIKAPKITPYKMPSAKVIKKHIAEEPPIDLASYTRNMAQRRTRE